jgi:hypothetical protein
MLLDPDPDELNQYGIQEDPKRKRPPPPPFSIRMLPGLRLIKLDQRTVTGRELAWSLEESCLMAWK